MKVTYVDGVQLVPSKVEGGLLACDRCGTFAELSWTWGKRYCDACRERQHPALSTPRNAGRLIVESVKLLPAIGWRGALVALLPLPFTLALRWVRPTPDTGDMRKDTLLDLGPSTLLSLFAGVAVAVLTCVLLQVLLQGSAPNYGAAWRRVRQRIAPVVTLAIILSVLEDFASLLLKGLGGLVVTLPLALAYLVLLHEDVGALAALRRSAFRMQGNYRALLGAMFAFGLPMMLAFVGVLIGTEVGEGPLANLVFSGFEGSIELLTLPFTVASVLLYVKLPPRMDVRG